VKIYNQTKIPTTNKIATRIATVAILVAILFIAAPTPTTAAHASACAFQ